MKKTAERNLHLYVSSVCWLKSALCFCLIYFLEMRLPIRARAESPAVHYKLLGNNRLCWRCTCVWVEHLCHLWTYDDYSDGGAIVINHRKDLVYGVSSLLMRYLSTSDVWFIFAALTIYVRCCWRISLCPRNTSIQITTWMKLSATINYSNILRVLFWTGCWDPIWPHLAR